MMGSSIDDAYVACNTIDEDYCIEIPIHRTRHRTLCKVTIFATFTFQVDFSLQLISSRTYSGTCAIRIYVPVIYSSNLVQF